MSLFREISIKDSTTGEAAIVNNGALDVNISDQTSQNISLFLGQHLAADLTIRTNTAIEDSVIEITSPTVVPVVGNFICMKEGVRFSQLEILSVANPSGTNYDITISMPNDFAFTTAATVCLQNCDMNIDGSSTGVDFIISPDFLDSIEIWHITRMIISMTHELAGDDGKFGGIASLTNGVYFRIEDGGHFNLYNAKENADFAVEGFDVSYTTRSGIQGTYGTRSRISFNGDDKRGVVIPLKASEGDKFLGHVRDDLTGLDGFRVRIQGHVVD